MDKDSRPINQNDSYDSDDSIPLAKLVNNNEKLQVSSANSLLSSEIDDLDNDPDYFPVCEVQNCKNAIYTDCELCNWCLCEIHKKNKCSNNHEPVDIVKSTLSQIKERANNQIEIGGNPRSIDIRPTCEIGQCREEVFAACNFCYRYLCYDHLDKSTCAEDHIIINQPIPSLNDVSLETYDQGTHKKSISFNIEEIFQVDGSRRENSPEHSIKKKRGNKKKIAKELRNKGEEYISVKTKKIVPKRRFLKERCNGAVCSKFNHKCMEITDEERQNILNDFYNTEDLQLQREYIVRFVSQKETKRKTAGKENSRRKYTVIYTLPKEDDKLSVCKKMFMSTLSVSEKTIRTALAKVKETGVIEKDKRGGRLEHLKDKDLALRSEIQQHINRFPRMESHFCRKSTTKEYLHPDLNIQKMLFMFNEENKDKNIKASYYTYWDELKKLNLSFHHPKKDQCGLCNTYREGDASKKAELNSRYHKHIAEKQAARKHKEEAKKFADEKTACICFDLQQVILLPKSNESQLFYHRRLSNFNLTIYNLASKQCDCYLWHECISKRGSSEISSCIFKYLQDLDKNGVEEVFLFSDGCSGQNKNSAFACMLLHQVMTSTSIVCISLKFFEPYHGQNEGDSAHSAISSALSLAGDVFVPSELIPIIKLARHKKPYSVHYLESKDFSDFKSMAKDLRVLSVRQDDNGDKVDWPSMMEYMVLKKEPNKIFFKTSHLDDEYRTITLPRSACDPKVKPQPLNKVCPKLSAEKYKDLMALCSGPTPVIRNQEHASFYKNLPHQ